MGTNSVNLLKLLCKEKRWHINIDFEDVVFVVFVVRDGEEIPPAQIQVSAVKQETKAAPMAEKRVKLTDPR